jgi:hypothetical protein
MNDRLFQIGIFPWFMILASTIFFPADWLKKMIDALKENRSNRSAVIMATAVLFAMIGLYFHRRFELLPFFVAGFAGAILIWLFFDSFAGDVMPVRKTSAVPSFTRNNLVTGFVCVWAFIQIALPLRHFFIPGNVSWTEEAHRFSWHMKLRGKDADVKFFAYDPQTGEKHEINPRGFLKSWQYRKMTTRPYMIHQFAKFIDEKLAAEGRSHFEVRVEAKASLNYRPFRLMIDPEVDLSKETYSDFRRNKWILLLDDNLKPMPVGSEDVHEETDE